MALSTSGCAPFRGDYNANGGWCELNRYGDACNDDARAVAMSAGAGPHNMDYNPTR